MSEDYDRFRDDQDREKYASDWEDDEPTPIPNEEPVGPSEMDVAELAVAARNAWKAHAALAEKITEQQRMIKELQFDLGDLEVAARKADARLLAAAGPDWSHPRLGRIARKLSTRTLGLKDNPKFLEWAKTTGRARLEPPSLKALTDDGFKFLKNGVLHNDKTGETVPGVTKESSPVYVFEPATDEEIAALDS